MLKHESRVEPSVLTTAQSAFIGQGRHEGHVFIEQPYELYSKANHEAWRKLFFAPAAALGPVCQRPFSSGHSIPVPRSRSDSHLNDVNRFLKPLTGFEAKAVSGYIPAFLFFDCLRNRQFPTTVTIRSAGTLDYLPEPDNCHDVVGHVPMHTDKAFAETLVRFGECAHTAVEIVEDIRDEEERVRRLTSIVKAMARFFWFTIEFGLMQSRDGLRVYGSGLLSSFGEIQHAIISRDVQRYPIQPEWVINQAFAIDHYQPLLFIVNSFDHLFSLVDMLEKWMRAGKLSHVAPGEPEVNERDLRSFLQAVA